jgi:hypothetical protein
MMTFLLFVLLQVLHAELSNVNILCTGTITSSPLPWWVMSQTILGEINSTTVLDNEYEREVGKTSRESVFDDEGSDEDDIEVEWRWRWRWKIVN